MAFGIVLEHPKTVHNLGTVLRSAFNFGAAYIATIGPRYKRQPSDTLNTWKHLPVCHFRSWDEARRSLPLDWRRIGVELDPSAEPLPAFEHPRSCLYVFGPEDGSLSKEGKALCQSLVVIPTNRCLNLAVAASVVM
jgi:tRNA(Leu) C34 or U34 (ribose-2'-O)-methylase TrmL